MESGAIQSDFIFLFLLNPGYLNVREDKDNLTIEERIGETSLSLDSRNHPCDYRRPKDLSTMQGL